jgi:hypothetical protein
VPALTAATGCHHHNIFGTALQAAGILPTTFAAGLGRFHRRTSEYGVAGSWSPASLDDGELFEADLQKPAGLDDLIERPTADKLEQLKHSWNPDDRSLNIFIKEDDDDSGLTVCHHDFICPFAMGNACLMPPRAPVLIRRLCTERLLRRVHQGAMKYEKWLLNLIFLLRRTRQLTRQSPKHQLKV